MGKQRERIVWTKALIRHAVAAVRASPSMPKAAEILTRALGQEVTANQLQIALQRAGHTYTKIKGDRQIARGFKAPRPVDDAELKLRAYKEQVGELERAREVLVRQLADKESQLGVLGDLRRAKPPKPIVARRGRGDGARRQGVPVFLFSDWHVEEPVFPEAVNGLNRYDLDVADTCIKDLADAVDWFARDPRWDFRQAVIWLGGDLFSGYIHEELVQQNFLSPVKAVLWLQEKLEAMFLRILSTTSFERIIVPCNDGNHGRLTHKIRVGTRTSNSLEWLMYRTLAERFRDEKRLEFHVADGEYLYEDVYDTTLGFTHGDHFRYQGGVGGLLIPLRKGFNEIRKYRKLDHLCVAHFHTRLDDEEVIVNGSMIGINAYSMHIHSKPEPRRQSFFVIDSEEGKCVSAPVWLPDTGVAALGA